MFFGRLSQSSRHGTATTEGPFSNFKDSLTLPQATDSSGVMTGLGGIISIVWRTQNHVKVVFKSSCCFAFVATPANCSLQTIWHILVWSISPIFFPCFFWPLQSTVRDKVAPRGLHLASFESGMSCKWLHRAFFSTQMQLTAFIPHKSFPKSVHR